MVSDEKTTGERLRAWRTGKGWSQARLAQELGTRQRTYADWEAEELVPDVDFAEKLERLTDGYVRMVDWAAVRRAKRAKDESGTDVAASAEKAG